jgi:hypothetical protein
VKSVVYLPVCITPRDALRWVVDQRPFIEYGLKGRITARRYAMDEDTAMWIYTTHIYPTLPVDYPPAGYDATTWGAYLARYHPERVDLPGDIIPDVYIPGVSTYIAATLSPIPTYPSRSKRWKAMWPHLHCPFDPPKRINT